MHSENNEGRGDTVNLPKLAVVTTSSESPKNFAYSGDSFIVSTSSDLKNISLFYNEVLLEIIDQYDAFAFLEKEDCFTFLESCDIIMNKLYQSDMVGAVYSDSIVVEEGSSSVTFSPSFSHNNYTHNNRMFHQPIFIKRDALKYIAEVLSSEACFSEAPPQYFDSRIKKLCFHSLTAILSGKLIISHIAQPLLTCKHRNFQNEEINEDLKLLLN